METETGFPYQEGDGREKNQKEVRDINGDLSVENVKAVLKAHVEGQKFERVFGNLGVFPYSYNGKFQIGRWGEDVFDPSQLILYKLPSEEQSKLDQIMRQIERESLADNSITGSLWPTSSVSRQVTDRSSDSGDGDEEKPIGFLNGKPVYPADRSPWDRS